MGQGRAFCAWLLKMQYASTVVEFPELGLKFDVSRALFSIGNFTIHWYAIFIMTGILLAGLYAYKNSRRFGLDFDRVIDVVLGGMIGSVVCARLYYVIFSLDEFISDPLSVFFIWKGGLAIYGAIIGAFTTGYFMCKWRKVPVLPMFDMAGIGFFIGQALGRWGNFFNVEAFGSNTELPWGMTSNLVTNYLRNNMDKLKDVGIVVRPDLPVHPTFLYESLWCVLGFVLLHFLSKKRRYDGQIFLSYIGFYGLGRFFIEGFRSDSLMLGNLRISQVIAGLAVLTTIIIMLTIRSKIKQEHNENYLVLYANTPECAQYFEDLEQKNKLKNELKNKLENTSDEGTNDNEIEDGE